MSEPFLGEIKMFGGNFAPRGYAMCNGQLLPIAQNTALFSLLGTTYGGNGQTTYALPNMQGNAPMQPGSGPSLTPRDLGEMSGTPTVTLLQSEMPVHTHLMNATSDSGTQPTPSANAFAFSGGRGRPNFYTATPPSVQMGQPATVAGGSQPHNNMQPYQAINFIIAMQGIYPARN